MNLELFNKNIQKENLHGPLAERLRPDKIDSVSGDKDFLKSIELSFDHGLNLIFYGPPGVGKTTIARILVGQDRKREVLEYRPAVDTLVSLKKMVDHKVAQRSILFIDEIHRMDKRQQDYLLPLLESGTLQLVGATTENPFVFCNNALLSRVKPVQLEKLSKMALSEILDKAKRENPTLDGLSDGVSARLIHHSEGDARKLLGFVEQVISISGGENLSDITIFEKLDFCPAFDLNRHFDLLSAIIKSMRSGDVDEAIGWLGQFLSSGGDPLVIARRLIVFASEDVGNAAPFGLSIATSCLDAVKQVGMPECRINLAHVVSYLARAPKSRAAYNAINSSLEFSKQKGTLPIPNRRLNKKNTIDCQEVNFPKFYVPSGDGHDR